MWNKAVFSVALIGFFSMIHATVSPESLKVRCGQGSITQGLPITIEGICNANYSVIAPGLLMDVDPSKYPLKLALSIKDDEGVMSTMIEKEIANVDALVNKENITDFVSNAELTFSNGECFIRGASLLFELKAQDGTILYQAAVKRRIWCDNSGVDLAYVVNGEKPTIYLSDVAKSLKAAMAGLNFGVQAQSLGTAFRTFPTQEGVLQLGIFGAAFVTKYRVDMALTKEDCLNKGYQVPALSEKDIVVAFELFKDNAEVNSVQLLENVRMNEEELNICGGDNVLVFLIDALNTLSNEGNRCNNFVTVRINSTRKCDTVPPRCELIRNAWSNGQARVIFDGHKPTHEMESNGGTIELDEERIEGVHDKDWEMMIMKQAFGRLKLLGHYIERQIAENSQLCTDEPASMIKAMEEDTEHTADDSDAMTLPANVKLAVDKIKQLADKTADVGAMKSEIQNALTALKNSQPEITSTLTKMIMEMETRALEMALSILNLTVSSDDQSFCELPWYLEGLQWDEGNSEDQQKHFDLALDTVSAYVSNPDLTCLERIIKRFLMYAKAIDSGEDMEPSLLIADEESLAIEEDLRRCAKPIKCLNKLKRKCHTKDIANWQDVDESSKAEICKMYVMKKFAKDHFMAMGMKDLYNNLTENNDRHGENCNRDPLKPDRPRSQAFWRESIENGRKFIYQGMMNGDASQVAWRKKAVCTCAECAKGSTTEDAVEGGLTSRRRRK